jgi:2-dehydropantoate 2-reductase
VKICVYGAGAIGGYLAGRLAKGGAELSVVARGPHLSAIRAEGLTVHTPEGVLHSRPAASDRPADLGPQDAVVVCTKVPALSSVADGIGPLLGPDTAVAFVTNGIPWWYFDRHGGEWEGARLPEVDPGDAIRRAVGVERTVGGVVYAACSVPSPGVVEVSSRTTKLILGEPDGERSARAVALAGAFKAAASRAASARTSAARSGASCSTTWRTARSACSRGGTCATPSPTRAERRGAQGGGGGLAVAAAMGRRVSSTAQERIACRRRSRTSPPSSRTSNSAGRWRSTPSSPCRCAWRGNEGVPTPTLSLLVALATQAAEAAGLHRRGRHEDA